MFDETKREREIFDDTAALVQGFFNAQIYDSFNHIWSYFGKYGCSE